MQLWNLLLSESQYEGIFTSEKYGSVEILYQDGQFVVMAGNLNTIATHFLLKIQCV